MLIADVIKIVVNVHMPILTPFLLLMMALVMANPIIDVIHNAIGSRRSSK